MKTHFCSYCKQYKPKSAFHTSGVTSSRDHTQYYCKTCTLEWSRENAIRKKEEGRKFRDRRWVCNRLFAPTSHIRNPRMVAQRRLRKESGIETANKAGMDFMSYYALERGKKNPLRKTGAWRTQVVSLCNYWSCDPEDLFPAAVPEREDYQRGSAELGLSQYTQDASKGDVVNALVQKKRWGLVYNALERLDERNTEILTLHFWDGLSLEDIGRSLNISGQAVGQRFYKALARITRLTSGVT